MRKKLKVGVLMTLDTQYKYDVVRGIIQFTKKHGDWALFGQNRILHNLADLKKWKGDGIITHIENKREADRLTSLNLPLIDVCGLIPIQYDRLIQYTNDDFLTGKQVAEYFLKEGFTEFAFVGVKQRRWSIKRKKGFSAALPSTHHGPLVYERPQSQWDRHELDKELVKWLKRRPLAPLALMAADDHIGAQVIEVCNTLKIHVPNEVTVIGTNNNLVTCEFCNPPLSSIPLDCLQIGFQAASSLHELMTVRKKEKVHESRKLPPLPIVSRGSISYETSGNLPVRDAMDYIRKSKGSALTVDDVVRHSKTGRRALEIKFKKISGRSIYEEICHQKIQRACMLLQRSSISISEIAFDSGFNNYQRFHAAFRKYMQTSPKTYREKHRMASDTIVESSKP